MARCPECRYSFRTLDDEEGMHDCPRCGYTGHDDDDPEPDDEDRESDHDRAGAYGEHERQEGDDNADQDAD